VIGDPTQCLIAMGARRDKTVHAAFIGAGKDAYVVFKSTKLRKAHALHFTTNAQAARVRDYFDAHKGTVTQNIELSAPTAGRTLSHRKALNKKRRAEIKNGAEVKKRGKPKAQRVHGLKYRPRVQVENNVVTLEPRPEIESTVAA
jgi:hypothetical protein